MSPLDHHAHLVAQLEQRNAATAEELRCSRDREKALREQVAQLEAVADNVDIDRRMVNDELVASNEQLAASEARVTALVGALRSHIRTVDDIRMTPMNVREGDERLRLLGIAMHRSIDEALAAAVPQPPSEPTGLPFGQWPTPTRAACAACRGSGSYRGYFCSECKGEGTFAIPPAPQGEPQRENTCEHGDHPAPAGKRFCSEACLRCEQYDAPESAEGCVGICWGATPDGASVEGPAVPQGEPCHHLRRFETAAEHDAFVAARVAAAKGEPPPGWEVMYSGHGPWWFVRGPDGELANYMFPSRCEAVETAKVHAAQKRSTEDTSWKKKEPHSKSPTRSSSSEPSSSRPTPSTCDVEPSRSPSSTSACSGGSTPSPRSLRRPSTTEGEPTPAPQRDISGSKADYRSGTFKPERSDGGDSPCEAPPAGEPTPAIECVNKWCPFNFVHHPKLVACGVTSHAAQPAPASPPRDERPLPPQWKKREWQEGWMYRGPGEDQHVFVGKDDSVTAADTNATTMLAVLAHHFGAPTVSREVDEAAVRAKRVPAELMAQLEEATRASEREAIAAAMDEECAERTPEEAWRCRKQDQYAQGYADALDTWLTKIRDGSYRTTERPAASGKDGAT